MPCVTRWRFPALSGCSSAQAEHFCAADRLPARPRNPNPPAAACLHGLVMEWHVSGCQDACAVLGLAAGQHGHHLHIQPRHDCKLGSQGGGNKCR